MNYNPRDQLQVRTSWISSCWARELLLPLNKIIENSTPKRRSVWRNRKLSFSNDNRSLTLIYDYFRVTGAHDTVLDYTDLFSNTLLNDDVQDFDTRRDEILLSATKILSDDVLKSQKMRIRETDPLKNLLELYDMEIHQMISIPNYQKLKTTMKRSINQKLRLQKLWRREWEDWNRCNGFESEGHCGIE